ncbi:pyridoxamine 5'-phosphate oxidase family protein [Streptomyces spiramenti]|uniref:Pyridoxamine 5'-phosphate oxidase family protein n=1 Tax=Streptomyces spiramenti TaxID=2720606 RepID=A0ABX1AKQ3_9ACTN|nr:pyridoxamine 5'-phosphate oxidase family protein [Streptomyces spiramenti]NJP66586.1 pyridoxamine 5'-phosphate oxidase family protein [Streptomyces spiramenti]
MPAYRPSDQLAEALRLLPSATHGRAAVTRRALPFVLVAQHLVTRGSVLLRIPSGQIESRVLDGTVLAYHAHPRGDWNENAPGVQLVGSVSTVRPTDAERAAFDRSGAQPATLTPSAVPAPRAEDAGAEVEPPAEDPPGTLYARLDPMLATVRLPDAAAEAAGSTGAESGARGTVEAAAADDAEVGTAAGRDVGHPTVAPDRPRP